MAIVLELIDAEIEAFHSNVETGSVDDKSPTRSSTPDKSREMYGPPQDCKGKFGREDKSAQMYSAFGWRSALLAMMSCARVCPSKSVGCSFETILGTRLRTRRFDCSFVLAAPVQTSVGKAQAAVVVR